MDSAFRSFVVLCSIAVICSTLVSYWRQTAVTNPTVEPASEVRDHWRFTAEGWQDSRTWRDIQAESEPAAPGIHPLLWALGVLFLALGAMIWSSEETELSKSRLRRDRLTESAKATRIAGKTSGA